VAIFSNLIITMFNSFGNCLQS